MSKQFLDQTALSDGSSPSPPPDLADWAALYPSLSLETIALAVSEATESAHSQGFDGARSVAVISWLVSARLQELSARLPDERRDPQPSEPGADIGALRLNRELAENTRHHLNRVSEEVFISHAGEPPDVVLAVLMRQARAPFYEPQAETLQSAAYAISMRRRFVIV